MVTTCVCVLWACAQTLSATDFYEALGRVADMKWLPTARDLEVLGVTNCYDFFARMRGAATAVAVYPHAIQHTCSPVLPRGLRASGIGRGRHSSVFRRIRQQNISISLVRRLKSKAFKKQDASTAAADHGIVMAALQNWQPESRFKQMTQLGGVVKVAARLVKKAQAAVEKLRGMSSDAQGEDANPNAGAGAGAGASAGDDEDGTSTALVPAASAGAEVNTVASRRSKRPLTASETMLAGKKSQVSVRLPLSGQCRGHCSLTENV